MSLQYMHTYVEHCPYKYMHIALAGAFEHPMHMQTYVQELVQFL